MAAVNSGFLWSGDRWRLVSCQVSVCEGLCSVVGWRCVCVGHGASIVLGWECALSDYRIGRSHSNTILVGMNRISSAQEIPHHTTQNLCRGFCTILDFIVLFIHCRKENWNPEQSTRKSKEILCKRVLKDLREPDKKMR